MKSQANKPKIVKWKLYTALVVGISVLTLGFSAITTYTAYPTAEHRATAQKLAALDKKALSSGDIEKVRESSEYKELAGARENIYTTRMAIGSSVLSAVIGVAIVVALYRYLRRNEVTESPIAATVVIDTAASVVIMLPSIFIGEFITGIKTEPMMMAMLLVSMPFAAGFSALLAYIIAKVTEGHYNRSHGITEK